MTHWLIRLFIQSDYTPKGMNRQFNLSKLFHLFFIKKLNIKAARNAENRKYMTKKEN